MSFRFLSVGQTLTSSEHFVIGSPYDYENDDDNNNDHIYYFVDDIRYNDDKNEDDYDYSNDVDTNVSNNLVTSIA